MVEFGLPVVPALRRWYKQRTQGPQHGALMRHGLPLLAAGLLLCFSRQLHAQKSPEQALATFTVTDPALELTLWASEPLFVNPTCIDIDHKGRVWVCESVNYRTKLMRKPRLNRPEGDRIVILEDTKGT